MNMFDIFKHNLHLARSVLLQIVANKLRKGIEMEIDCQKPSIYIHLALLHFISWGHEHTLYIYQLIYIYKYVCMWWDNPCLDFSNLFNHELYNEYPNFLQSFPNIGRMFHKTLGTHVAFYEHFCSLDFLIVSRLLFTDVTFLTLLIPNHGAVE